MAPAPVRLSRRDTLLWLGAATLLPHAPGHAASAPMRLAATWEQAGQYRVGLLQARPGAGQSLGVLAQVEVPTRAHGLALLPTGHLLATARRPGDWMLRWHPARKEAPQWLWVEDGKSFNGHVLAGLDGRTLYTTETDLETGASLVGVRDARSLEKVAEWPTHGIDAHELIWDRAGGSGARPTLIVANGGVPTAPETGRIKRDLDRMDSSLVRLDAQDGKLQGQWRLQDPRLSLRHLAWSPDGRTLGIALQAEHDDAATKAAAPIFARFDGEQLHTHAAPRSLAGYGGSIAATQAGWAVSCPRVDGVARFAADGAWQALVPLEEVCALAPDAAGQLWAAGLTETLEDAQGTRPTSHPHARALAGARMDNHWVRA